ncbi:MAG TPA: cytochrome c family protein [Stellaceae bacterium]|nr:cytochrome c family protein [Stellaceae bacterium]
MTGKESLPGLLVVAAVVLALFPARARAQDGAQLFKISCAVCHSAEAGQNKVGPSLFGVVGRKAGTSADYAYSEAMKNSGFTWTSDQLDKYLANPKSVVPNTKMIFLGLKNPDDRKAIVDYLASLK